VTTLSNNVFDELKKECSSKSLIESLKSNLDDAPDGSFQRSESLLTELEGLKD
jgi:hypothetical protein